MSTTVSDAAQDYDAQVNVFGDIQHIANIDADVASQENAKPNKAVVDAQSTDIYSDGGTDSPSVGAACKGAAQSAAGVKRFQLLLPCNQKPKVPRAENVNTQGICSMVPLPQLVRDRIGAPDIVVGFDVETHDWIADLTRKGSIGPFGWYRLRDEASYEYGRIIQIGWAIANIHEEASARIKSRFVKPSGFQISAKATNFHSITQEKAECDGIDLAIVLREFLDDVRQACRCNGRVVAHHLEFDAGIIDREIHRCGLEDLREEWQRIAKNGYCTMNPELGRWMRMTTGREVGPATAKHCEGLQATVRAILPAEAHRLNDHHDASSDADLTRAIYTELLKRSRQ